MRASYAWLAWGQETSAFPHDVGMACRGHVRAGRLGEVADGRGELAVLGVEGARRRRQPEDRGEPSALVEDRRRDAAEVAVELLAVDRVAEGAHPAELGGERLRCGDRARRVAVEPACDVARERRRAQPREHDLAHRERVRVVGDLGAEARHAGDALAAAHDGDLDHAAAHDAEVAALVGAQEEVVDGVLVHVAIARGDGAPGRPRGARDRARPRGRRSPPRRGWRAGSRRSRRSCRRPARPRRRGRRRGAARGSSGPGARPAPSPGRAGLRAALGRRTVRPRLRHPHVSSPPSGSPHDRL